MSMQEHFAGSPCLWRGTLVYVIAACFCVCDLAAAQAQADNGSTFIEDERRALLREPALDPKRTTWVSGGAHGSLYDSNLEMLLGRAGVEVSGGYRPGDYGFFGTVQSDVFWDFGQEITRTSSFTVGLGADLLNFHGRIRSAAAVGLSTLLQDTALVRRGASGLFYDLIPAAMRYPWGENIVIEVAPLHYNSQTMRVAYPPFALSQFVTSFNLEWRL